MAWSVSVSDDYGDGRSLKGISNCTHSTSLPFWDTKDDDDDDRDDCGPKPSWLYGKYTWKIENFSQISKRELRSRVFEVGGCEWCILLYPEGCDFDNHLSLFLCIANHDELLPGWNHLAQFTMALVNKDPKKSKYFDALHWFWNKEHDWGWKKLINLLDVQDGFIVADTLVIRVQVQVIREKLHHPFRCFDCQYKTELVRVYLTNVEHIFQRFVDERRAELGKLIEDKVRWSSCCAFWSRVDQTARHCMSRERTDVILKTVMTQLFIEKEVTSTFIMESLCSGLKAIECQSKSEKGRAKLLDTEETSTPIVCVKNGMFVLVEDCLLLVERASLEPFPPKGEKGPQSSTKDRSSGEDFNMDSTEHDERWLTELGRRTLEIFSLAHIFSHKIEVAYCLNLQEELIREKEAAKQAESEQKTRLGTTEKLKRTKKKQNKKWWNNCEGKDKSSEEKFDVAVQNKQQHESTPDERTMEDSAMNKALYVLDKPDAPEYVSDGSFTGDNIIERFHLGLEHKDASRAEKNTSVMDDSSSTCSIDSVLSVVMNDPYKGVSSPIYQNQTLSSRGKNGQIEERRDQTDWALDMDNQEYEPVIDVGHLRDDSRVYRAAGPESEADVLFLMDRIQWLEQPLVEKEKETVTLQRKLIDVHRTLQPMKEAEESFSRDGPTRNLPSNRQPKPMVESATLAESFSKVNIFKSPSANGESGSSKSSFTTK